MSHAMFAARYNYGIKDPNNLEVIQADASELLENQLFMHGQPVQLTFSWFD